MITKILALKNVGPFERWEWPHEGSADAPPPFGRVTVIAGENGKGKTTIAAVLRSLQDNDPGPVLERRRGQSSGGYEEFLAKVEHDAGKPALTSDSGWVGPRPVLYVFDDVFVSRNVYEGLTVGSEQREALHELVVGEAGVQEAQKAEALGKDLTELKKRQKALAEELCRGMNILTLDRILRESAPGEMDAQLSEVAEKLRVAAHSAPIRALPEFLPVPVLPGIPIDEVGVLLDTSIEQVAEAAQRRVLEHIRTLGRGADGWVQTGLGLHAEGDPARCPFCDQALGDEAEALIAGYRSHFSNEYAAFQGRCALVADQIRRLIPESLVGALHSARERLLDAHRQWAVHMPDLPLVPELPDTGAILAFRDGLLSVLDAKRDSPLSQPAISDETEAAAGAWDRVAEWSKQVNALIADLQGRSRRFRATSASLDEPTLKRRMAELNEWRAVSLPECQERLAEFRKLASAIDEKAKEQDAAKAALQKYQDDQFPKFCAAINALLDAFGATFRLKDFDKTKGSRGGERRVDYVLQASTTEVRVSSSPAAGRPHFGSVLSAGDRRTLAFAFFLTSLSERNLDGATVVCDDPTTSLDLDRRNRTVMELMGLARRGAQLVVLSHFEPLLLDLEDRTNRSTDQDLGVVCLRIEGGPHQSRIVAHRLDRRPRLVRHRDAVRAFVKGELPDQRGIPNECRKLLEGVVQFCFPDHYRPGGCLKDFCEQVETLINGGLLDRATFDEIRNLRDFFNPESHFRPAEEPTASEIRTHAERLMRLAQVRLGEMVA